MDQKTEPEFPPEVYEPVVLTPQDVLNRLVGREDRIRVKGYFRWEEGRPRLVYGDHSLALRLENGLSASLPAGSLVVVEGLLRCTPYKRGVLYPYLVVQKWWTAQADRSDEVQSWLTELETLLLQRPALGFAAHIRRLLEERLQEGSKPLLRIGIVHGRGAQTHHDFAQAFVAAAGRFAGLVELRHCEVSLTDDEALARAIEGSKGLDALFLVRGGGRGEELGAIGGPKSFAAAALSRVPVYAALGHSLDRSVTLMEKAAQHTFATPSLAGTELGALVRDTCERGLLPSKLQELEGLRRWKKASTLVIAVLILLLLGVLIWQLMR